MKVYILTEFKDAQFKIRSFLKVLISSNFTMFYIGRFYCHLIYNCRYIKT